MSEPRVPEAAIDPVANDGAKPREIISGIAMRDIADAVATDEPEAAAKRALATTLAQARLPGTREKSFLDARNKPFVKPVSEATNPIKRNIGTAEKLQLVANSNGSREIEPIAALMLVSIAIPVKDTAMRASPMGIRIARRPSIAANAETTIQ